MITVKPKIFKDETGSNSHFLIQMLHERITGLKKDS